MTFIFEQSDTEIYASHAGLVVAGPIINRHSGLKKRLKSIPLRHGIAHIDLVRTYLGLPLPAMESEAKAGRPQ